MADFYIKQNDTSPSIEHILADENGVPINITGASVRFHMNKRGSSTSKIDAVAEIINAVGGVVRYGWQVGDTDITGLHMAEWEVTYSNASTESFPNDSNIEIYITEELS